MTIASLPPEELAFFLMRYRRGETLERYEPRLDHFLREILSKANEFVPSESGVILLDDPRAKIFGGERSQLTLVTAFGGDPGAMLGRKLHGDRGVPGQIYSSGVPLCRTAEPEDREELDEPTGLRSRSLLGVPVVLGNSICGVLLLVNRVGREAYSEEDRTLIQIFAGYISSSIQNMIDGIRAKELARRDDLTGLFNDRYFHYRLREEIARAETAGSDLALLFLDLDRFKEINDQHGHLEGSRVLHELGILIESQVPAGSISARYGGDEFVIILPGAGSTRATEVAQHLQGVIATAPFLHGKPLGHEERPGFITASVGVATLIEHVAPAGSAAQRANSLIRMADAAMYRAKAEGRNRVVVAMSKTKEYPIATPSRREPTEPSDSRSAHPGGRPDPGAADHVPGSSGPLRHGPGHRRPG